MQQVFRTGHVGGPQLTSTPNGDIAAALIAKELLRDVLACAARRGLRYEIPAAHNAAEYGGPAPANHGERHPAPDSCAPVNSDEPLIRRVSLIMIVMENPVRRLPSEAGC
jgi:hypothetical protein